VGGERAASHPALPVFVLPLSKYFARHREVAWRFRKLAFRGLTPSFFINSGMPVSLPLVSANLGLLALLLGGSRPATGQPCIRWPGLHAMFATPMTGLTLAPSPRPTVHRGRHPRAQFSELICVVVVSAVVPTAVAQRLYVPHTEEARQRAEQLEDEDEVARPRHHTAPTPSPHVAAEHEPAPVDGPPSFGAE
jgi:hypothetical protein